MSVQYAGGTNVNATFTTTVGTRREIVDNVSAQLATAGWNYISGQNTADVLLESAVTPAAGNKIRLRILDPGSGNCAQLSMRNMAATLISRTFYLLPTAGKVFRIIANHYQFFCFVPGTTNAREFVMCSVPYIPAFLNGVITGEFGFMNGNAESDTDTNLRISFRTAPCLGTGNNTEVWAAICNSNAMSRSTAYSDANCAARLVIPYSGRVQDKDNGYRWHDDSLILSEPLLAWGLQNANDEAKIRGQLWDAVWCSENFVGDLANFNFDGHNWYSITAGNGGSATLARGTLLHVIP